MRKFVLFFIAVLNMVHPLSAKGVDSVFPVYSDYNECRNCEEIGSAVISEKIEAEPNKKTKKDELEKKPVEEKAAEEKSAKEPEKKPEKQFIKWIEFNVSKEILEKALNASLALNKNSVTKYGTCELLAYIALKNGNSFNNIKRDTVTLNKLIKEMKEGKFESIERYSENKYFKYYIESFHAVLDGVIDSKGVKGYFPLARGYWCNDYDDFGNSRGYGFKRRHLGHDMFGGVGTPIIAVEGGTVTELGWNQYGGWRIGIRSHDTKRYYYYAHLRKNKPYPSNLKIGDSVKAGQVIGYLGVTGYSRKPNTNMTTTKPHLHFGMQIIFDPSQEDGNGEIWIDVYQICRFLARNKMAVKKNSETKEFEAVLPAACIG